MGRGFYHRPVLPNEGFTRINFESVFKSLSRRLGIVELDTPVGLEATPSDRWGRTPVVVVEIASNRRDGTAALPVRVILGYERSQTDFQVLGWRHAPR